MRRWNWRFKQKAPLSFKLLIAAVALNLAVQMSLIFTVPKWGRYLPDLAHSYPLSLKGKGLYFVQPWLGRYVSEGLWVNFVLIAAVLYVVWRNRAQIERGS
jgi:hypothetical protein